jgi:hypothetical protein
MFHNNYCSSVELQAVSLDKKLFCMELNVCDLQSDMVEDIGSGAGMSGGHTHSEP